MSRPDIRQPEEPADESGVVGLLALRIHREALMSDLETRAVQFSTKWGTGGQHAAMMVAFAQAEIERLHAVEQANSYWMDRCAAVEVERDSLRNQLVNARKEAEHWKGLVGRADVVQFPFIDDQRSGK